ncbi:AAA family ATPase [Streptomyces sp. NPDC057197]|uniref:helix-turn-helix transcriptional regulator n=1 Tax=Streptomyces sp. NPDC057197 TaxID=3346045 RepID=UPI00363F04A3
MLGPVETRSVSPVFVGREHESDTLREALARAGAGEPQALLIGGEAGVGKTRLVEEFAAAAARGGAVVALGGCVEMGADGLPFAAFSTALRALRRELPDALAAASAGQEEDLARLLPELAEQPAARGTGRPDEEGTARLFELTARLLEQIGAGHTVLLVLEDLHWADASTRHLLSYLFRTLRTGRLVVLATYRSDDIHRRHPLRPLLAELDRLRTVRRIELERFTRQEVGRQIAGILATEPDPAQIDRIFERSDGNAFFVEELAVCASERCADLSDSLRDLLLVRVEALPEDAQRVVRIAAEGGSTVEYRLLAAVARLAEDDLIEALRAAVNAHILTAAPTGDAYRFRHALVREAVGDDLLPGERSRLNRRYAEALEADASLVPADQRVLRLASYWYHAHDPAKALPAVLDASVTARARHAYSEQLRLLERAMELWDTAPADVRARLRPVDYTEVYPPCGCDPATTPLRYLDLMAEAAVAGRLCGERDRAMKIIKRALRHLDDDHDPLRAAWFWIQRSRLVQAKAQGDGWRELARAQDLVRGLPPSEVHAEVLANVANWSMIHEPGPDAFSAAERAVEYARMVGAQEIEMTARLTLGGLRVEAGDVDAGLAEMREVNRRTVADGIASVAGRSYVNLPSELESVGRSREAVPLLEQGIEYTRRFGRFDHEAYVWGSLAESLFTLGRWEEAAEAACRSRRVGQSARPRAFHARIRAELALARGELAKAAAHLADGRAYFGTHDCAPQHTLPLVRIAIGVAAGEGRLLDARAEAGRALRDGFPPGTQRYAWPLLLSAATVETRTAGLPATEEGRADALARIRRAAGALTVNVPVWQAYERWVHAELAYAEGSADPEDWAPVVAAFETLERPYELARVRLRLAEALLTGGEDGRERATELLRLSHAVAEHLRARPLADSAALLAQRARLSLTCAPPPGPPEDPAEALGLTQRERDVLRLVARGRTNRQIAEELFISPKTASVHVSNILAKLGVSGRGEAAAVAHRLELFPGDPLTAPTPG